MRTWLSLSLECQLENQEFSHHQNQNQIIDVSRLSPRSAPEPLPTPRSLAGRVMRRSDHRGRPTKGGRGQDQGLSPYGVPSPRKKPRFLAHRRKGLVGSGREGANARRFQFG